MLGNLAFLDLGTPELVLILLIVLLLFGGKKLPELSRGIGTSLHELRKGTNKGENENEKTNTKSKASARHRSNS
jgi:sec-independent protein translocase protein TatA